MTLANATLRAATPNDLPILQRFEASYFGLDQFSRDQLRYLLTKANATNLVAEHKGEVVGAATVVWRRNANSGRLYSIVVDRRARGLGIGTMLLEECERIARERGCVKMTLEVRTDNRTAITLYQHHGYTVSRKLEAYYSDGCDGLRMVKGLGAGG